MDPPPKPTSSTKLDGVWVENPFSQSSFIILSFATTQATTEFVSMLLGSKHNDILVLAEVTKENTVTVTVFCPHNLLKEAQRVVLSEYRKVV